MAPISTAPISPVSTAPVAPPFLILDRIDSPIGRLALAFDEAGVVRGVDFDDGLERSIRRVYPQAQRQAGQGPQAVLALLHAYFDGDQAALARVPWSLDGAAAGDGFQARVWRELARIPPGQTISYGEMARRAGEAGAAQAAGVALNRNPLPLVLPCHRVVGADGAMVGFGGGLER